MPIDNRPDVHIDHMPVVSIDHRPDVPIDHQPDVSKDTEYNRFGLSFIELCCTYGVHVFNCRLFDDILVTTLV